MTKKEQKRILTQMFYDWMEENYPEFQIDDYGNGGRIDCGINIEGRFESFEYHRSRFTTCYINETPNIVKQVADKLEQYISDAIDNEAYLTYNRVSR